MSIFVTGAAGFIGYHLCERLLALGHEVVGYDGLTDYYDVRLKQERLQRLLRHRGFRFVPGMLEDAELLTATLGEVRPRVVYHLAAQAGVRYSIEQPQSYISSNVVGTANLLEALRAYPAAHLMFASTSSVYGGSTQIPFREDDRADNPISLYAATKRSGEVMTHSYAHLWQMPTTCFRFFTVYGPWGRPDMALFKFVGAIERGEPIEVYNEGKMLRDFTYIDDLIDAVVALGDVVPVAGHAVAEGDSISAVAPWRVVNIAGGRPVGLNQFIDAVEAALSKKAIKILLPRQPGDMLETSADPALLHRLIGETPQSDIRDGVRSFVGWYRREYVEVAGRTA